MSGISCFLWWMLFGTLLGWLASWLFGRLLAGEQPRPVERIVEKVVERPVDRVVEKPIDSPALLARIKALEGEAALVVGLRDQVAKLQAAPPRVVEKIVEKPVERLVEKIVEVERWPAIDLAAARAAGFTLKSADDLEIIEGIGPKIAEVLNDGGVRTFAALAVLAPAQVKTMLDKAGPQFALADPGTWPEQSSLAARNHWQALKALQTVLIRGLRGE